MGKCPALRSMQSSCRFIFGASLLSAEPFGKRQRRLHSIATRSRRDYEKMAISSFAPLVQKHRMSTTWFVISLKSLVLFCTRSGKNWRGIAHLNAVARHLLKSAPNSVETRPPFIPNLPYSSTENRPVLLRDLGNLTVERLR